MAIVPKLNMESPGYTVSVSTGTAADGGTNREPAGEFGRFEDLASKLIQVPKSEVDEKRKKKS
jgi:hypothetical protein